jgi:hypothetical protein
MLKKPPLNNDLTSLEIAEISRDVNTKEKVKRNSSMFLPPLKNCW